MVSAALALLIAAPLGVAIAIFLTEDYLPLKVRSIFKFLVELLAAIPSVIYGLWGIYVIIPITTPIGNWLNAHMGWFPLFSTPSSGPGFLPAAFVLAIMILPTIAALSSSALKTTPQALKEGACALGATRWDVILQISLPIAASGIFGAAVLALGRAMGETMALAMLVGNNNQISASHFRPGQHHCVAAGQQLRRSDRPRSRRADVSLLHPHGAHAGHQRRSPRSSWNAPAQPPAISDFVTTPNPTTLRPHGPCDMDLSRKLRWRAIFSRVMDFVVGAVTLAAFVPLVSVLYMVISKGAGNFRWSMLWELPPAAGMDGGGFGNALVGTLFLVGIGALSASRAASSPRFT